MYIIENNIDDKLIVKHQYKYSLGTTYKHNEKWKWRAGFALDKTAVQEEDVKITLPSSDRYWYSAGLNYTLSPSSNLDFALLKSKSAS